MSARITKFTLENITNFLEELLGLKGHVDFRHGIHLQRDWRNVNKKYIHTYISMMHTFIHTYTYIRIVLKFMPFDKCFTMIDLTSLLRSKYDIVIMEECWYITFNIYIIYIIHMSLSRLKGGLKSARDLFSK